MMKKFIHFLLNIIMILTIAFSLVIYGSGIPNMPYIPWYENSGAQFLTLIFITLPILLLVSLGLKMLSKSYEIEKSNLVLPIHAIVGIIIPIVIDGSLNRITLIIGMILCILFLVKSIIILLKDIINLYKKTAI